MKKRFQAFREECRGAIALEACIGLTVFMMLMLAVYSLVPLFMAQNIISHALLESCQSLAIESYGTSKIDDGKAQISDLHMELLKLFCSAKSAVTSSSIDHERDAHYITDERWFDIIEKEYVVTDYSGVEDVARERFATYLAGGIEAADEMLENLGVVDGLDGVDFTGTKLDGSDLVISIQYTTRLKIRLEMFGFGEFSSVQQVCSRLWGSA